MSVIDLKTLATAAALAHNLNVDRFLSVIGCESHWHYNAVSKTNDYGLVQVHLKSHPDITREQAEDPYFALNWAAEQWQAGNAKAWTCFRKTQ